ncbi:MAG: hypothetical protein AAGE03_10210 [Pseudomonadota bacterium]
MSALMRAALPHPWPRSTPSGPDLTRPVPGLALLRDAALACRIAPRRDPQAACALIWPEAAAGCYARALLQALPGLMGRRTVIWGPGSAGQSFDEAWLMAILAAVARRDADSLRFLTERRLRPGGAETVLFLIRGLMARLDKP